MGIISWMVSNTGKLGYDFSKYRGDQIQYYESKDKITDPEDKGIERNSFKERPDIPAGHRMLSYPYSGQAWHPNFDTVV
jgi:hypothetical protein